jgi:hypothetical protein
MEGSKVDGGDGEVAREVAAFDIGVGVAPVGEEVETEALCFCQYLLNGKMLYGEVQGDKPSPMQTICRLSNDLMY